MDELRNYLFRVVSICTATALARGIVRTGTARKVMELTCGLLILLTILRPLAKIDIGALSASIGRLITQTQITDREDRAYHARNTAEIIKEKTEAYIWDKASEENFKPTEVSVEVSFGGTYPYASGVLIGGPYTELQKERIGSWIETMLAIPEDRQQWRWSKS
ncbi:MAG: hypothetical protein IJD20_06325 [Oscillospiraceae bacterium]|nr:hypothetical protein [Oscillospiraceae bacterium]